MEFLNLIPSQQRRAYFELFVFLFIMWIIFSTIIFVILSSTTSGPFLPQLLTSALISAALMVAIFFLARRYYLPRPGVKLVDVAAGRISLEKDPSVLLVVEKGSAYLRRIKPPRTGAQARHYIGWKEKTESLEMDGSSRVELTFDLQAQKPGFEENPLFDEEVLSFPALRIKAGKKSEVWVAFTSPRPLIFLAHHQTSSTWKLPFKKLKKQAKS